MQAFYILLFGICIDYFEPVNTLCLPFLEKGNVKLYSIKVWKVGFFNLLFYLVILLTFVIMKNIIYHYREEVSEDILKALEYSIQYVVILGGTNITGNFMRGSF